MNRLIVVLFLFPHLLMGVDSHAHTSADPWTGELELSINGEKVIVNLSAPGVRYRKDGSGALVYIEFFKINRFNRITFFPQEPGAAELIQSVTSFEQFGDELLLSGQLLVFDRAATLRVSQGWDRGKLDGVCERWDHNGMLMEKKVFEQGFPIGNWENYYDSGELAATISFPESKQAWLSTAEPGQIRDESTVYGMTYIRPLKGLETWYDNYGKKQLERELLLSVEEGQWRIRPGDSEKHFSSDGALQSIVTRTLGRRLVEKKYPLPGGDVLRKREEWIGGELFRATELRHGSR